LVNFSIFNDLKLDNESQNRRIHQQGETMARGNGTTPFDFIELSIDGGIKMGRSMLHIPEK
jgi:hypothetical protein